MFNDQFLLKLIDFGLAVEADPNKVMQGRVGTEGYQPPEMLKGENTYKVGQVDLFACAVILFSMVYGVPPFGEAKS